MSEAPQYVWRWLRILGDVLCHQNSTHADLLDANLKQAIISMPGMCLSLTCLHNALHSPSYCMFRGDRGLGGQAERQLATVTDSTLNNTLKVHILLFR